MLVGFCVSKDLKGRLVICPIGADVLGFLLSEIRPGLLFSE